MKVEIWSDVICPFCYIGKRRFEAALAEFDGKDDLIIEWKSFQLDPSLVYKEDKSYYERFSEMKNVGIEESKAMHQNLVEAATDLGLTYNFDKAKITNTFDAHRLIQLAKKHQLGDEAEEQIFEAYFTEGKLVSDAETLRNLGLSIGLPPVEIEELLNVDSYQTEVTADLQEAQSLGIRGVPFFVFDRKYAVSGAQPKEVFLQALQKLEE